MSRLPDFVMIGAMKCATTTLADQLSAQDGLFITTPKEPCYFSDDDVYERGFHAYSALFDEAAPDELVGEASTHYTKLPAYPHTIARMQAHGFAGKLVYIMRHPVDRLVSHYIHAWTENEIDCSVSDAVDRLPGLIDYGRYAMQIDPYLEAFGKSRVLPVFYDRMVASPLRELARVCDFLGHPHAVAWDHSQAHQNVSADRMRASPMRDQVINAPGVRSVCRWFPRPLRKLSLIHI